MPNNPSNAARDRVYHFKKSRDTQRKIHDAQEASGIFLDRLETNQKLDDFDHEDRVTILGFMTESVLNIDWYDKKMKRECTKYIIFCVISFGLLDSC